MIIWDFNAIVALGITLSLGVVIVLWMFYSFRGGLMNQTPAGGRGESLSDCEFLRQCGFCGYLYFDYFKKVPAHCPRCGSYQN